MRLEMWKALQLVQHLCHRALGTVGAFGRVALAGACAYHTCMHAIASCMACPPIPAEGPVGVIPRHSWLGAVVGFCGVVPRQSNVGPVWW